MNVLQIFTIIMLRLLAEIVMGGLTAYVTPDIVAMESPVLVNSVKSMLI